MSFVVRYSASARDDLKRLYEYLLDHPSAIEDLDLAERALTTIIGAVGTLRHSPFIYRNAVPGYEAHGCASAASGCFRHPASRTTCASMHIAGCAGAAGLRPQTGLRNVMRRVVVARVRVYA